MRVNEITPSRIRALADTHPEDAKVLSLFLDLDPREFATAPARSSAIGSLLNEAEKRIDEATDGNGHDARQALREDLERVRELLRSGGLPTDGARALAVFCCGPAGLFEVLRLPRGVESAAVVADGAHIEPLAAIGAPERWCVLLVNRKRGRILRGAPEELRTVRSLDEDVHGQHDQGGWSQARYERSVDREVEDHLRRVGDELFRSFRRWPFDHLVVACAPELWPDVEKALHPYVRERLAGRVERDLEHAGEDDVRAAVQPVLEEAERRREREALDRLAEGVGAGGRGAAGFDEVLGVLNEQRVEILLLDPDFSAACVACPQCGWMGTGEASSCPLDGTALERHEDGREQAAERAFAQSASVVVVRHHPDLGPLGGIGAVLRF